MLIASFLNFSNELYFHFRKQIQALKFQHKKDVESVIKQFSDLRTAKSEASPEVANTAASRSDRLTSSPDVDEFSFRPIGFVRSCHSSKNGSPRQPTVSPGSCGLIDVSKMGEKFNNPEYSLLNLEEFSHIWVIFVFHLNDDNFVKTKVGLSLSSILFCLAAFACHVFFRLQIITAPISFGVPI